MGKAPVAAHGCIAQRRPAVSGEKRGPNNGAADPLRLYDESVARALLGEEER